MPTGMVGFHCFESSNYSYGLIYRSIFNYQTKRKSVHIIMFYTDDFMAEVLKIKELPDYLYHYTSIQTLAVILKSKTLRFTRLDQVNDVNEGSACDIKRSNTIVFVSCWTDEKNESIPMWKIYTPNMDGVRVKLPINMFTGREEPTIFDRGGANILTKNMFKIIREGTPGQASSGINGPNKIYYTDNTDFKHPKCLEKCDSMLRIIPYDLGMVKSKHWAFENEWRYKICLFGTEHIYPDDAYTNNTILNLSKYPVTTKIIDVKLDQTVFNEIEICLGPKTNLSDRIITESLLSKFAPNAVVKSSELSIR